MLNSTLKNAKQGSHTGNDCGGSCIATIEHPSLGSNIMEVWKDIPEFEGLYQASTLGNIRAVKRKAKHYKSDIGIYINREYGGYLLNYKNSLAKGYGMVTFYKDGIPYKLQAHRLIAKTFIPNPQNKRCTNHKDGNKLNNAIDNLEWCTHSENMLHAYSIGLYQRGENSPVSKLNELQVRVIRKCNLPVPEIAEIFNLSVRNVYTIRERKTWKHI